MHCLHKQPTLYIFKYVKNTNFASRIVEPYGEIAIFTEQKNDAEKYSIFLKTEF